MDHNWATILRTVLIKVTLWLGCPLDKEILATMYTHNVRRTSMYLCINVSMHQRTFIRT